ncbi:kinase-like protein [Aspergillus ambiguus]|uniref:kinase-like protein n=1 Tax=Aspergillus ambiguus TaxID=176160 RepID=UPI003CCCF7B4
MITIMFHLSGGLFRRFSSKRSPSPVHKFAQSNVRLLDSTEKFEEEMLPWYSRELYYPVKIGEVFRSRYQVIGKLGFGGYSTVWLCRDLQQHRYVTLKIFERDSLEGKREADIYNHLSSLRTHHDGAKLVRMALDSFQLGSPKGSFQCLIHPPLGIRLFDFRNQLSTKVLPEKILKLTLLHVFLALDFLHTEAGIVHTDIQEKNILFGIEDSSILTDFEQSEKSNPSPRKIVGDRIIYSTRKLARTTKHGRPILCDFGQARFGSDTYRGDIQPHIYRAPEVLLRIPWDQKVDIWNIGLVTWDLFQQGHLFYARDSEKQDSDGHHLAEMIALLGPPPKDLLQKSDYATEFFDKEGNWKSKIRIPVLSLENLEGNLQGAQQRLFLEFMRKMLRWRPEERQSAKDLLSDPWLRSP